MNVDIDDMSQIEYLSGSLNKDYKYKALIPKDIWNKYRTDALLTHREFKTVKFGRPGYMQYKDRIGLWSDYDHKDKKRRELYKIRHEPILITLGNKKVPSYKVPFTNEFFSYYLMW